jgi:hypothetical protein
MTWRRLRVRLMRFRSIGKLGLAGGIAYGLYIAGWFLAGIVLQACTVLP